MKIRQQLRGALRVSLRAGVLMGVASIAVSIAPMAAADQAPPWSAPATTTVVQEEKTFQNAGAELSGTLYVPRGGRSLPAIVVTHTASLPLRDQPLYQHLKDMLPSLGIAVFVYDRRGSGKSGGDLQTSDYTMLADDAIAAIRAIGADPRIDSQRVGIWGLSQGGWLALLAASRSPQVAFAISISAPLVTPDVQMMFLSENMLRVNGYSQADIDQALATRKAVDDYMRGHGDRATAQRMVDAAKQQPWFKLLYMGETVGDRATSRWRKEIEHDPALTLDKVSVPVLLLYGTGDPVVPVAASVSQLQSSAGKRPNVELMVIAGADHHMETSVEPKRQLEVGRSDQRAESPEYFGVLANWLTRHGIARHERSGAAHNR